MLAVRVASSTATSARQKETAETAEGQLHHHSVPFCAQGIITYCNTI